MTETLRQIGENELIRRIRSWLEKDPCSGSAIRATERRGDKASSSRARRLPPWARMKIEAGIGDDTAIVRPSPGAPPLALTTDMMVEGVHFLPDHPPEDLGAKAVASNLSDLAAVGAWPAWILVSFGAPARTPVDWVRAVYRGMSRAAAPFGCLCIGGDCVRSDKIAINIVAGGNCSPDANIPLRSRARAGQSLYVTGTLGDSAAGLFLLQGKTFLKRGAPQNATRQESASEKDEDFLIARHRRPTPRVEAGIAIARFCPDAAMMDLSDGLAVDLPRLAEASGCGFEVRLDSLPVSAPLARLSPFGAITAKELVYRGGEDYELVFATAEAPEKWRNKVARAAPGRPLRIARIGRVVEGEGVRLVDGRGNAVRFADEGFKHF